MIDDLVIRTFTDVDRPSVIDLWRQTDLVRPWNDPSIDIDRKLAVADGLFLVAERHDHDSDRMTGGAGPSPVIVGTVMVGYEGHRGWLNYLAVDPLWQGRGIGRRLVAHAEAELVARGCPKVNLMVRSTNPEAVAFYRSLGYDVDDVTALGKRLIIDR